MHAYIWAHGSDVIVIVRRSDYKKIPMYCHSLVEGSFAIDRARR